MRHIKLSSQSKVLTTATSPAVRKSAEIAGLIEPYEHGVDNNNIVSGVRTRKWFRRVQVHKVPKSIEAACRHDAKKAKAAIRRRFRRNARNASRPVDLTGHFCPIMKLRTGKYASDSFIKNGVRILLYSSSDLSTVLKIDESRIKNYLRDGYLPRPYVTRLPRIKSLQKGKRTPEAYYWTHGQVRAVHKVFQYLGRHGVGALNHTHVDAIAMMHEGASVNLNAELAAIDMAAENWCPPDPASEFWM